MLRINKKYVVDSDEYQFILKERRIYGEDSKRKGEVYFINISYHANIDQLLSKLRDIGCKYAIAGRFGKMLKLLGNMKKVSKEILKLKKQKNGSELRNGHENRRHRTRRRMD